MSGQRMGVIVYFQTSTLTPDSRGTSRLTTPPNHGSNGLIQESDKIPLGAFDQ
jgi:hypothetical protein